MPLASKNKNNNDNEEDNELSPTNFVPIKKEDKKPIIEYNDRSQKIIYQEWTSDSRKSELSRTYFSIKSICGPKERTQDAKRSFENCTYEGKRLCI